MMKELISIKDHKALTWSAPVLANNKADAMRMFGDLVNDKRTLIGQHPEDFELRLVGTFDDVSGCLEEILDSYGFGSDYVRNKEIVHDVPHQV